MEDIINKSFIDRLNMLEKLGYINDAQHWFTYRKARNSVAHEYPENLDLMLKNLEEIIHLAKDLSLYWDGLRIKINIMKLLS